MSYYFVNDKYPISDPNIDLNFNNDILYQHMLGDEAVVDPRDYKNGDQQPRRSRKPTSSDIRQKAPSYNIFLSFILIVILALIVFYMTRPSPSRRDNRVRIQLGGIDKNLTSDLVMLGPGISLRH